MATRSYPCVVGAFVRPLLQWKGNTYYIFWVCVCSLWYPACKAHAPYRYLLAVRFYNIFFTFSHKRNDFRKKVIAHKICILPLHLLSETFFILRRTGRDTIISVYWSSCISVHYSTHIWMKLALSQQIFEKMLKYQISWKSIQCEPSCSMRTGGRTDKTTVIVTFRNLANALKTPYVLKLKRKVLEGTKQWQRGRCRMVHLHVILGCKDKLRNRKQAQKGLHRSLFVTCHLKIQDKGGGRFITSKW